MRAHDGDGADPRLARAVTALGEWGRVNRRDLPWRATRDPWLVLVSEVMLQQTPVQRVVPRWARWCELYPSPGDLAAAPLSEVLREWQGLGYPRRARNLRDAAARVVQDHDGRVPDDLGALLDLPGVGPYTARAVLVFAHGRVAGVVDTNVGRVLARWSGRRLRPSEAQVLADEAAAVSDDPWAHNQAMFDFAAAWCTKRAPTCTRCPARGACAWSGDGADPAEGSAATSRPQARFEGSLRQARGRVLASLAHGPRPVAEVHAAAALSLEADGLVERSGSEWMLSGDASA